MLEGCAGVAGQFGWGNGVFTSPYGGLKPPRRQNSRLQGACHSPVKVVTFEEYARASEQWKMIRRVRKESHHI